MKKPSKKNVRLTKLKETYRLWVKFLKLSTDYKEYCENIHLENRERTRKDLFQGKRGLNFIRSYDFFGDIHSQDYDFEVWWQNTYPSLKKLTPILTPPVVAIVPEPEENATSEEDQTERIIGLDVNLLYPKDILLKRCRQIIHEEKKRLGITRKHEEYCMELVTDFRPVTRVRRKELELYLRVYQMRNEGMEFKDILKDVSAELKPKAKERITKHTLRRLYDYPDIVEQIMKNVENGSFPGEY